MEIKVLLFGILAEEAGAGEIKAEDIADLNKLKDYLETAYPAFRDYNFLFSVNGNLVHDNRKLNDGDEVGALPPFAGG